MPHETDRPAPQAERAFAVVEVATGRVFAVRLYEENAHQERRQFGAGNPEDFAFVPCTVLPTTAPLPPAVVARAREQVGATPTCTCAATPPTMPVYRALSDHLPSCPAYRPPVVAEAQTWYSAPAFAPGRYSDTERFHELARRVGVAWFAQLRAKVGHGGHGQAWVARDVIDAALATPRPAPEDPLLDAVRAVDRVAHTNAHGDYVVTRAAYLALYRAAGLGPRPAPAGEVE